MAIYTLQYDARYIQRQITLIYYIKYKARKWLSLLDYVGSTHCIMPYQVLQACVLWWLRNLPSYYLVCTKVLCLGESCCFFFYWQYGEIQDYRQSLSPATLFIKNASVWMTNKNVASVLNRCKLLLIQCTLFKFYNVKLLPKGDNAVICAWTLRRQQWPFESSSLSLVQT